jgi:hypothetical protein
VRLLLSAKRRRLGSDLLSAQFRALVEDSPSLLLDRDTVELGLKAQALGDEVIEVADDDRSHGAIVESIRDSVKCYHALVRDLRAGRQRSRTNS